MNEFIDWLDRLLEHPSAPDWAARGAIILALVTGIMLLVLAALRGFTAGKQKSQKAVGPLSTQPPTQETQGRRDANKTSPSKLVSWAMAFISAAFTLFFAYRTIEDSNREQAETRISDQGYVLGGYEFEHAEIRCLYSWYDGTNPDWCRGKMFDSNHRVWSLVMLYIEEVLWLFDATDRARETHNIVYSADINYWRDDVASDRTGAFSFYIVEEASESVSATEDRLEYVGCLLRNTGLQALRPNLCTRYRDFRRSAPTDFYSNQEQPWCADDVAIPIPTDRCNLDSIGN